MKKSINLVFLMFVAASICRADSTLMYGARPLGMAGSYTAIAENIFAQYWNPAGLGLNKGGFDFQIPVGASAEFTGNLLESVNNIGTLAQKYNNIEQSQKNGSSMDISQLSTVVTAMKNLNDIGSGGSGFMTTVSGGTGVRIGPVAVSINNYVLIGAKPYTEFNFWLGSSTVSGMSSSARAFAQKFADTYNGIKIDTVSINVDSLSNPALATEKAELLSQITWLKQSLVDAGVQIPAGITNDQIANALINAADSAGVSQAEIKSSIDTVKENKSLIESLITGSSSGNPFANNGSNLTLKGINITEISVGYGRQAFMKDLYVGANVKFMQGTVGYYRQNVFDKKVNQDSMTDFSKNSKQTAQLGLDIGLILDKRNSHLRGRFGLMMKNINKPQFAVPDEAVKYNESAITLDPQVRFGMAFYPAKFWAISSDIDLTNNTTLIPGYVSKTVSIGTEINIFNRKWLNVPLRFGYIKNIAYENPDFTYTVGLGLNLAHFVIDLSAASSTTKVIVDKGQSIPKTVSGQVSISLNF
jgi:hypothetical protein